MGKIPKGSESIANMRNADAIVQYKNLGNGVRTNSNFSTPDVVITVYDAAGVDFEEKVADKPKTPPKTAALKAARLVINRYYNIQATYVNRICNGDAVKLKSSNIIMNKESPVRVNPFFTAVNGTNPGDVNFACKADKHVSSFLVECRIVSDTEPTDWTFCKVLGSHVGSKGGFTSGLVYEFRMKYIYSTTEGAFFDSVTLRIM